MLEPELLLELELLLVEEELLLVELLFLLDAPLTFTVLFLVPEVEVEELLGLEEPLLVDVLLVDVLLVDVLPEALLAAFLL